jgi:citrate lyase synthetase
MDQGDRVMIEGEKGKAEAYIITGVDQVVSFKMGVTLKLVRELIGDAYDTGNPVVALFWNARKTVLICNQAFADMVNAGSHDVLMRCSLPERMGSTDVCFLYQDDGKVVEQWKR